MAISDKEWFVICETLVPNPEFSGTYKNQSFQWTDSRPYPSQAEINQAIIDLTTEEDKQAAVAAAKSDYNTALAGGYLHTDGITYYCNERAVMDLCMVSVLNTLSPDEPVYVMSMSHGVVEMTLEDFQALSVIIGRHTYDLRQAYWAAIMAAQ